MVNASGLEGLTACESVRAVRPCSISPPWFERCDVRSTCPTIVYHPRPRGGGPKQVEISQHQHALVTVNADCKIIEWDQYGDNIEQEQLGVAVNATIPYLPLYLACVQGPNPEAC